MKITIYEPKEPEQEEKELCLRLTSAHGLVELRAVDPVDGRLVECGIILSIGHNGIRMHGAVNERFGLPLDNLGCVKVIRP